MTRQQANLLGILISVCSALGGWLNTLHSFSDGLDPHAIGGLLILLAGALGGGMLIKSPEAVRTLPKE